MDWNRIKELGIVKRIQAFVVQVPYRVLIQRAGRAGKMLGLGLIPFIILVFTPSFVNGYLALKPSALEFKDENTEEKVMKKMERDALRIQRRLDAAVPRGGYIVINTTTNTFRLYQNREMVREGTCSTGSYVKLVQEEEREWMFKTPKGIFRIQGKVSNPVWRKPDWAFVEEGLPVPPPNHPSRYEYGVLGDYALSLGDGYLIHGTLYQRFLGMPVTHGCVRLGDDDLEAVFKTLPVGAKVFIY